LGIENRHPSGECEGFSRIVRASRPPETTGGTNRELRQTIVRKSEKALLYALLVLLFRFSKTGADSSRGVYIAAGQVFAYNPGIRMLKD
jgi:hypothetical protein